MKDLCCDVILGRDFHTQHDSVHLRYGRLNPFSVCGLAAASIDPPELFSNLSSDCKPIATKLRRYNSIDKQFIDSEVQRLLCDGVIEPSNSPWRAQVVVTKNENHKKRMVVDYSETINKFTNLDAYPLPRLDDTVNKIAQYSVFSTIDLKSAYHQIPIRDSDKIYTAFQANGGLYQFTRIPFGVTNGVACFQRVMNRCIEEESLDGTFAYLDNVFICGHDQQSHDENLSKFKQAAAKLNITFNEDKCEFSKSELAVMGHIVGPAGQIKPDPEGSVLFVTCLVLQVESTEIL